MILRLILSLLLINSLQSSYTVVVTAIFRDEARFLKEWIDFYKTLGVEHFYLYNNLSLDNYQTVLNPYLEEGVVTLIQWPYESEEVHEWNRIQCGAYKHALYNYGTQTKWMAFLDTDEFLFPTEEATLPLFLKNYELFGAVSLNWQCYGHNSCPIIPDHEYMIGILTRKEKTISGVHRHVKTIVQPKAVLNITNPHYAKMNPAFLQVTAGKIPFAGPFSPFIDISKGRINHYWPRDMEFMETIKIGRRKTWGQDPETTRKWAAELNRVEDLAIYPILYRMRTHALSGYLDKLH